VHIAGEADGAGDGTPSDGLVAVVAVVAAATALVTTATLIIGRPTNDGYRIVC
jgi:hypothetical protein